MTDNLTQKVYLVLKNDDIIAVFSTYDKATHYCEVQNGVIPSFAKQDEELYVLEKEVDSLEIAPNKVVKTCWDYIVYIDKDISTYGEIKYLGTKKDIVDNSKTRDVEHFETYIGCRSYISKDHAYQTAMLEFQMYEQQALTTVGV